MSTAAASPRVHADVRNFEDVKALRAKALYENDAARTLRKSHENPSIKRLYQEYLGEPGSEKSTSYPAYNIRGEKYQRIDLNLWVRKCPLGNPGMVPESTLSLGTRRSGT